MILYGSDDERAEKKAGERLYLRGIFDGQVTGALVDEQCAVIGGHCGRRRVTDIECQKQRGVAVACRRDGQIRRQNGIDTDNTHN